MTAAPPSPHPSLPRRPLTVGELLDAAVQLLRGRSGLWLLVVAAGLAIAEQGGLFLLRGYMGISPTDDFWDTFGLQMLILMLGVASEAMIINMLGPMAGRRAAIAVGITPPKRVAWERTLVTAPVVGFTNLAGLMLGPFWILGYGLFGVSGASIGLENRGAFAALGRGARLAFRGGMRVTWVRLLGYFSWLLLRLAFFAGLGSLMSLLAFGSDTDYWIGIAGSALINTATYAYLAALDACALVESRFRSEAWDIRLNREALPALKAVR
ncbi:MAG TPA: hypothetical protein VFC19_42685 [Candidatus Limnocylindrales bacterium]|nr:hypothetical protein [Candidatus Limnocylindrales bacterium]